jgi:hypothetical protein
MNMKIPPQPPLRGGSCEIDAGWKEFVDAWWEPIVKVSIVREVWRNLTEKEQSDAIAAARGYCSWRKKQRNPSRYSAQSFLRERDCWPQFVALVRTNTSSPLVFELEGSTAWLARVVIAKVAGMPPPAAVHLAEGRGGRFNQLPEEYLALAQFAPQDPIAWQFVRADQAECLAWCTFLKIEPRQIAVATKTKELNGREYSNWPIKEHGLKVPCPFPPTHRPSSPRRAEQQSHVSNGQAPIHRTDGEAR